MTKQKRTQQTEAIQPNLHPVATTVSEKAQRRLAMIKRAKKLGNVSLACLEFGVSRPMFYQFRNRYEKEGMAGLEDRPPVHKSHPHAKSPEEIEMVKQLAIKYPYDGMERLSRRVWGLGGRCSPKTVRNILDKYELDSSERKRQHLEKWPENAQRTVIEPRPSLARKESRRPSEHPGQKLCQFVFLLRNCGELGAVYVHAVVDTYTLMAWTRLAKRKSVSEALGLLQEEVLPFYRQHRVKVDEIETQNSRLFKSPPLPHWMPEELSTPSQAEPIKARGRSFENKVERWRASPDDPWAQAKLRDYEQARQRERGSGWFRYREFLRDQQISFDSFAPKGSDSLRANQVRGAGFNGFAEQLHYVLRSEFFTPSRRRAPGLTLEQLKKELDDWLRFYNEESPHPGFPNWGDPPTKRFTTYKLTQT